MNIPTVIHDRCRISLCVCAVVIAVVLAAPGWAGSQSVNYTKHWLYKTRVHVITVNMNDREVYLTPILARHGIGTSEGFGSLLSRTKPTAAITGTFFDTKSLRPTGDIVIDGYKVYRGVVGTAVGVDWQNQVSFIPTKKGRVSDWSSYRQVLAAGPMIVCSGKSAVYIKPQGFKDQAHFSPRVRTAVGVTKLNKLLLVSVTKPIYLSRLAKIMIALGCRDAATLDGGGSTALYYRGKTIVHPSRKLTNLLAVYDSWDRYEQALGEINASATKPRTAKESEDVTVQL